MTPLISVIIPVYNIEKYIGECLESVVNQTYRNIEIIIIDDCSTDKSYYVCKSFSDLDQRIILIKNEINKGLSKSRNIGMKHATGEFLLFIDGDDTVSKTLCQKAVDKLNEYPDVDLIHWGYEKVQDVTNEHIYTAPAIMNSEKVLYQPRIKDEFINVFTISYQDLYHWFDVGGKFFDTVQCKKHAGVVWCYLFRKKVIDDNSLKFSLIKYTEDLIFTTQYLLCCNGIAMIDEVLSFYRNRDTSIMHEKRPARDKIKSLETKELILQKADECDWETLRNKWRGQTCVIAMNAARVENLKDFLFFVKADVVRDAIKRFDIKKANNKFKIVFFLLKAHLYIPYWCIVKLLMKMGKFGSERDIC